MENSNTEDEELGNLTFGQKIADKVALFGGSWTFIISFFLIYNHLDFKQCVFSQSKNL